MSALDLATTTLFVDFDGTITATDTAVHLLNRMVGDRWQVFEAPYRRGEIGSRECMASQWALIERGDPEAIKAIVAEVPIDPGFERLVALARETGAEIIVLSDGYGIGVDVLCAELGVTLHCNRIDWDSWSVVFGSPEVCACPGGCGTCRRAAVLEAQAAGRTAVLVGDGLSDRRGAGVADLVFAKGDLAEWCREAGRSMSPSTPSTTLSSA